MRRAAAGGGGRWWTGQASAASKRENTNSVRCGPAASYMCASPSMAPSAMAAVVNSPPSGYRSTLPVQWGGGHVAPITRAQSPSLTAPGWARRDVRSVRTGNGRESRTSVGRGPCLSRAHRSALGWMRTTGQRGRGVGRVPRRRPRRSALGLAGDAGRRCGLLSSIRDGERGGCRHVMARGPSRAVDWIASHVDGPVAERERRARRRHRDAELLSGVGPGQGAVKIEEGRGKGRIALPPRSFATACATPQRACLRTCR